MAKQKYTGWILFDRVTLIQHAEETVQGFPKIFISDSSNTQTLESGKQWAAADVYEPKPEGGYNRVHLEGTSLEVDNKGFTLELLDCAGHSSQGGNLSFWMCKVTKDGQSWSVGISAPLLLNILKSTTFVNGVCTEKLFFARKDGQVGMLCESMEEYKNALRDFALKTGARKAKKTRNYVEGNTYSTLTQTNAFLGVYWQWFTWEEKEENFWQGLRYVRIRKGVATKLDKPIKRYWFPSYLYPVQSKYLLIAPDLRVTLPARELGTEVVSLDGDLDAILNKQRADFHYNMPAEYRKQHRMWVNDLWFISTNEHEWVWPEGMKECLIEQGWTVNE